MTPSEKFLLKIGLHQKPNENMIPGEILVQHQSNTVSEFHHLEELSHYVEEHLSWVEGDQVNVCDLMYGEMLEHDEYALQVEILLSWNIRIQI